MKNSNHALLVFFLAVILCLLSFRAAGQSNEPHVFLNGEEINFYTHFINPNRMVSLRVNKNTPPGEIRIKTKNKEFSFHTLKEIVRQYTNLDYEDDRIVYRINETWVSDRDEIQVDDTYHIYVEISRFTDIHYLFPALKDMTLVEIKLEREERPLQIRGARKYLR